MNMICGHSADIFCLTDIQRLLTIVGGFLYMCERMERKHLITVPCYTFIPGGVLEWLTIYFNQH